MFSNSPLLLTLVLEEVLSHLLQTPLSPLPLCLKLPASLCCLQVFCIL
jgi:hypothetical protein